MSNSPLKIAVNSGNKRIVEIVLYYMAKIDVDASEKFCMLFSEMTEFKNFYMYLEKLPF